AAQGYCGALWHFHPYGRAGAEARAGALRRAAWQKCIPRVRVAAVRTVHIIERLASADRFRHAHGNSIRDDEPETAHRRARSAEARGVSMGDAPDIQRSDHG